MMVVLTSLVRIHLTLVARITANSRDHYISSNLKLSMAKQQSTTTTNLSIITTNTTTNDNSQQQQQHEEENLKEQLTEELSKRYDHILHQRQELSLQSLINYVLEIGLPNLINYIQITISLLLSTPAYQIMIDASNSSSSNTSNTKSNINSLSGYHIISLFQTLLTNIEPQQSNQQQSNSSDTTLFLYSPTKIINLLFPLDCSLVIKELDNTSSSTTSSTHNTNTGGGITVQDLIKLATNKLLPTNTNPTFIQEFIPIPWTAKLLTNMTLDVLRSPNNQIFIRTSLVDIYNNHMKAILIDKLFTKGLDTLYPLGPLIISLRFATDSLLQNESSTTKSNTNEIQISFGTKPSSSSTASSTPLSPIDYLCTLPHIEDLCYQLMFNAKLN